MEEGRVEGGGMAGDGGGEGVKAAAESHGSFTGL